MRRANDEDIPPLEVKILSFVSGNGYTLKTDAELAEYFGASEKEIRDALRHMKEEALIRTHRMVYDRGKTGRMIQVIRG